MRYTICVNIPFLKNKKQYSGIANDIIKYRSDSGLKDDRPLEKDDDGLSTVAKELCDSLNAKDYSAIAKALEAAFQILEARPHQEGEENQHLNDESQEENE